MTEEYSLEALKRQWTSYLKEHGHVASILEASQQYPEVCRWAFDHQDMSKYSVEMAEHLVEMPTASLLAGERVLQELQPPGQRVPLYLCPSNLSESMRPLDIRARDAGRLVAVRGLVTKAGKATLHYRVAVFQCMRCGAIHRVEQETGKLKEPIECYKENGGCSRPSGSTKFRCLTNASDLPDPFATALGARELDYSEVTDEQWLTIQDVPDDLKEREFPTTYKARIEGHDVVGSVLPGERVMLYCIIRTMNEKRTTSPEMFLDVLHMENLSRRAVEVTEEDEERLRGLLAGLASPLDELLVPSFAPHVVGLDEPKSGIVCQLLGGLSGDTGDKVMRGEQHVLLIGNPGTGKSQLLGYIPRLMERANYVNADQATRAGLVARAERDGDGWVAVPGKVVLADTSVCAVDELNRMSQEDLDMLLESMESGKATITKAGSAEFHARTAILAAANPRPGYYGNLRESVEISAALASRFALVYRVQNTPETRRELQRVMRTYYGLGERTSRGKLDTEDLARFIVLARRLRPLVTESAARMIEMHHDSLMTGETTWTDRVLEDLYRLSVAVARSRLSEEVTEADAVKAIAIHSAGAWGEADRFDIDVIATGIGHSQRERMRILLDVIDQFGKDGESATEDELVAAVAPFNVSESEAREGLKRLLDDGRVYTPSTGRYRVI